MRPQQPGTDEMTQVSFESGASGCFCCYLLWGFVSSVRKSNEKYSIRVRSHSLQMFTLSKPYTLQNREMMILNSCQRTSQSHFPNEDAPSQKGQVSFLKSQSKQMAGPQLCLGLGLWSVPAHFTILSPLGRAQKYRIPWD